MIPPRLMKQLKHDIDTQAYKKKTHTQLLKKKITCIRTADLNINFMSQDCARMNEMHGIQC